MNAFHSLPMTSIAATVADVLGIEPPRQAEPAIGWLADLLKDKADGNASRAVMYNPDAVAMWLVQNYTGEFAPVFRHTQAAVPLKTVAPAVTPVCFASMYTGAQPSVHGVKKGEKPVVATDSLFDALIRAGKRAAIVAVDGSSMSKIYAGKALDYYFPPYDEEVAQKALELIEQDRYDFISVYTQSYDDAMHLTGTESPVALEAMRSQIRIFEQLALAAGQHYRAHNTLLCCCTDHGVHTKETGGGTHGEEIPEDMNIMHFFGIQPAGL